MTTDWYGRTDREAQASGMISLQVGCSPDEALALTDRRAWETDHTAEEIAEAVVDRLIRFAPAGAVSGEHIHGVAVAQEHEERVARAYGEGVPGGQLDHPPGSRRSSTRRRHRSPFSPSNAHRTRRAARRRTAQGRAHHFPLRRRARPCSGALDWPTRPSGAVHGVPSSTGSGLRTCR